MSHWATETIFLATAHFIAGIIGFFYRIFLSRSLGPQGMGIYQQVLSFYGTAITLMTAGIPLSVSKLIAEIHAGKSVNRSDEIVASAFFLTSSFAILGAVFLAALSRALNRPVLLLIIPAAVFVGFSSVLRGFFLGIQKTVPIRWSILGECLVRTLFGVIVIKSFVLAGLEGDTGGAVTALAVGEMVSLAILAAFYKKNAGNPGNMNVKIKDLKSILTIAIPVSLSQIIGSLSGSLEALLVPKCLEISGLSGYDSMAIYGKTAGMVLPLLYFPALFTMSLSSNMIPRIAAAISKKNNSYAFRLAEHALTLTALFSFAVSSFFIILARPVGDVLFSGFSLEKLIMGFAAGIPFFYTEHMLMALLRGTGINNIPLVNSINSFLITNILVFLLVEKPYIGIFGYSLAMITASSVSIFTSLYHLEKTFNRRFNTVKVIMKPILCSLFMAIILKYTYLPLKNLGLPEIICIGADSLLGATGFILMAMVMGFDLKS
ncbi:MAG TPA: oligosaccharide flippase family protein [Thermoanaerobacterales bacterium]|nr:oligosaccharide flippase family protein [Thermoanaerobacterales bacterium]